MESKANFVGKLNERCQQLRIRTPEYTDEERTGPSHKPEFTVRVRFDGKTASGTGPSKQSAKAEAAKKGLELLAATGRSLRTAEPAVEIPLSTGSTSQERAAESPGSRGTTPVFDPENPRKSLDALLDKLDIPPVVISIKKGNFPEAAARIEPSRLSPRLQPISVAGFFPDETVAESETCRELHKLLLLDKNIREFFAKEMAGPVPLSVQTKEISETQLSPTKKLKTIPEWKKVLFHYKKIIKCLKENNGPSDDEESAIELSMQLEKADDVEALERLGKLENFSVVYDNFPKNAGLFPMQDLDAKRLKICRLIYKNPSRVDPVLHFHGSGGTDDEAKLECASHALRYLAVMEEKICKGLA